MYYERRGTKWSWPNWGRLHEGTEKKTIESLVKTVGAPCKRTKWEYPGHRRGEPCIRWQNYSIEEVELLSLLSNAFRPWLVVRCQEYYRMNKTRQHGAVKRLTWRMWGGNAWLIGEETFFSNAYVFWGRATFTSGHSKRNELEAKKQDMQCTHERNIEARSCNHSCSEKAISITYCECALVALLTAQAMRVYHIVISDCPALQYFFHIIS